MQEADFDREAVLRQLEETGPLFAVRGNNDWGRWAGELPQRLEFIAGGVRFLMIHNRAELSRNLGEAQVVLFGHTHQYFQKNEGGRLWFNPGSCGYPRFGGGLTMAVLTLENGQVADIEKITLQEKKRSLC